MTNVRTLTFLFGLVALGSLPSTTVLAQGEGDSVASFGSRGSFMSVAMPAHVANGGSNCPGVSWHINRVPQDGGSVGLSGTVWSDDGSAVSFAQGAAQSDGSFTLKVRSISGNGPDGTVTGRRYTDGSLDVNVDGTPCFNGQFHLQPGQTTAKM